MRSSRRRYLAIIPAYNESRNIGAVITDIAANAPQFDAVVVDDGSRDDTSAVAARHGAIVLRLPFNLGIGGAVQTGFRYARDNGYEMAAQVDGDGQHGAACLDVLLEAIRATGADMVIGSRYLGEGDYKATAARRLGMVMLSAILSAAVRRKVTDPTSGLRIYNRRAIDYCAAAYPADYPEPEVIPLLVRSGLSIGEVPVKMSQRQSGKSSINWSRAIYYMVKVTLAIGVGSLRRSLVEENVQS